MACDKIIYIYMYTDLARKKSDLRQELRTYYLILREHFESTRYTLDERIRGREKRPPKNEQTHYKSPLTTSHGVFRGFFCFLVFFWGFFFFSFFNGPKSRTFVPKSTECYRDVNLILCLMVAEVLFFLPRRPHGVEEEGEEGEEEEEEEEQQQQQQAQAEQVQEEEDKQEEEDYLLMIEELLPR